MKALLIGLLALGSFSSFAQTPEEEIAMLCNFHVDYAKRYNPGRLERKLGTLSYPGQQKFKECVDRGLHSYNDGMLKVFINVCTVLPSNPHNPSAQLSLAAIRYSKECRESLIKTNIPLKEEFSKLNSKCKEVSKSIDQDASDYVVSETRRDYLGVIIENNCMKSKF